MFRSSLLFCLMGLIAYRLWNEENNDGSTATNLPASAFGAAAAMQGPPASISNANHYELHIELTPSPSGEPVVVVESGSPSVRTIAGTGFNDGDSVLCRWQSGTTWYPGHVVSIINGNPDVQFDDGDRGVIPVGECMPFGRQ